tara:strand:- start:1207 stop:1746 length:540 start_codon:yes stop_codon:yes gene_type:complete
MKNLFKLYDNILTEKEIDTLYGSFRDEKEWKFIGFGKNPNYRKFTRDLNTTDSVESILFEKANTILKKNNLKEKVEFIRAYASGQLYGMMHDIHQDDGGIKLNEIYTIMFYLNKIWTPAYSGETIFLDVNWKDIIHSILPSPGRAVLFDGVIPHGAREVSRECIELRMVATFKYKVKNV